MIKRQSRILEIKKARRVASPEILLRRLILRHCGTRHDVDATTALVKFHMAIFEGEQGPVATGADIDAGQKLGPALADDDAAGMDKFPAVFFYAQPFADAVATVFDAALTFLMCHKS
jgi:hypothetical protein